MYRDVGETPFGWRRQLYTLSTNEIKLSAVKRIGPVFPHADANYQR